MYLKINDIYLQLLVLKKPDTKALKALRKSFYNA